MPMIINTKLLLAAREYKLWFRWTEGLIHKWYDALYETHWPIPSDAMV